MNKKKTAFTLAEVLITLGIIGVVAAITMPILIANNQKQVTVNRLKQTYSLISQAVKMSEIDNGSLETWDIPNPGWSEETYNEGKIVFNRYFKHYLKIVKECKYLSDECWADEYLKMNGERNNYVSALSNKSYTVVLSNGSIIGIFPRGTFIELYIDLNGKKGPNKQGKDFFALDIAITLREDEIYGNFSNSGVYFTGQGLDVTLYKDGPYSCTKNGSGSYCGALIMYNGWKITEDYPW